ncbi:dodecin [Methylocaldum sp.]|uniref:dodecin n=1 Tax=Methylocaldum sp. TaxID=1969727 RepID=UPI002D4DFCFE|nr:dodecin [Methylocaldum sp.]HYE36018.1 dodecin [Methylocaldum sp.]
MTDRVYKLIEIVGTSPHGTDEAIRNAIEKASKTINHLDWFEVVEMRGQIAEGKIAHYQVILKVGFRIED